MNGFSSISDSAFVGCENVISVVIGNTIETISVRDAIYADES